MERTRMLLFALDEFEALGAALAGAPPQPAPGRFDASRFPNGEWRISLETPVAGEHCLLMGSITPPDEHLVSLLLTAHTLKKEGARAVTALLPYLAYSRQDKEKPGQSLATAWTGAALKAAGVDEVVTVDVHSAHDQELYPIPLRSLSSAPLLAAWLREWQLTTATLVAPDEGAIRRCHDVMQAAGIAGTAVPYFQKHRTGTDIRHGSLIGQTGPTVVLIDDILDTGATLVSACDALVKRGVEDIFILVTHGLFTGSHWTALWQKNVRRIACTDTVPLPPGLDPNRIQVIPVLPLLRQFLQQLARQAA